MPSFERSVFTHMHASAFSNAYEVKASYVKVSLDTVHFKFKTSGLLCNSTNLEYEGFNSEYETVVPLKILDKTRTRMVTKTSTYCVVTKRMRIRSCQRLELRAKKKELCSKEKFLTWNKVTNFPSVSKSSIVVATFSLYTLAFPSTRLGCSS